MGGADVGDAVAVDSAVRVEVEGRSGQLMDERLWEPAGRRAAITGPMPHS